MLSGKYAYHLHHSSCKGRMPWILEGIEGYLVSWTWSSSLSPSVYDSMGLWLAMRDLVWRNLHILIQSSFLYLLPGTDRIFCSRSVGFPPIFQTCSPCLFPSLSWGTSKQRISTHPPDELSALYPSRNVQKAFSGHLSLLWLSSFKNFLVLEIYLVSYLFMYKY